VATEDEGCGDANEVAMEFMQELTQHKSMKKNLSETVTKARTLRKYVPYRDTLQRAESIILTPEIDKMVGYLYHMIEQNVCDITDPWQFIVDMVAVLSDQAGKKRTLLFEGEPSSGKTLLQNVICSVYEPFEIGLINSQSGRSTFWFSDLIDKSIYVGEELILDQINAQAVKMLFEGNSQLKTDIKFGDHQAVPYRPVIITANLPIWRFCSEEARPIKARCLFARFRRRFVAKDFTRQRKVQRQVWIQLTTTALSLRTTQLRSDSDSLALPTLSTLLQQESARATIPRQNNLRSLAVLDGYTCAYPTDNTGQETSGIQSNKRPCSKGSSDGTEECDG